MRESYLDLIKPDHPNRSPFKPGMSATVDIRTETMYDVLSLPIQAVTVREDTTDAEQKERKPEQEETQATLKKSDHLTPQQEYVFLYADEKVKMIKVTSGIQDNMYIQIVSGLKENDEVITSPYTAITKTLKDDAAVKKVDKKKLFKEEKK